MVNCPACGYNNRDGVKFCNECGGKMETSYKCSACGHTNNTSAAFCGECGAKRGQAPAAQGNDPLSMLTPEQMAMIPPEQLAMLKSMGQGQPSMGHSHQNDPYSMIPPEELAKMQNTEPRPSKPKTAKPKKSEEEEMQEALALQESMKSGVMLNIDGKKFKGGSAVSATIIGLTDQMKADGAIAILVPAGAPHEKYLDKQVPFDPMQQYAHMMPAGMGAPSGMMMNVKLVPPFEGGDFEIRLFRSSKIDKSTFLTSAPFTATAEKEAVVTISLDKETYDPKGSAMVTVDNVSESMVGREAFIGLYKAGAGRSEPIIRKKLTKGENTVQLQLPDDIGGFEVRVIKDGTKPDETIAAKAKLQIKGLKCPSCGQENLTSLKGCAKCGATLLPGKCNECGYTDNPPGAEYCEICGAKRSA